MSEGPLSLRARIFHAVSWTLGGYVGAQAIRLASNLIMTRLLIPDMFGIMAIANSFIVGLALFTDLGIRQNIVHSRRGNDPVFLNTAWVMQILRGGGVCLCAISIALAFYYTENVKQLIPVGSVYREAILPFVIGVLSISAFIDGLQSTKMATASRNLWLGYITKIELSAQIIGISSMLIWAWFDRSIWALVAGGIISSSVRTLLSHTMIPGPRNAICWDWPSAFELFHFGKWVFLSSILTFLSENGDRLILGALIDTKALGFYVIALFIVSSVGQVFTKIAGSVAFPAFGEVVRDRPTELQMAFYRFRKPFDIGIFFTVGFFIVAGDLFISILYDNRYLQAGQMIEVLSLLILLERYSLVRMCFLSLGKPKALIPITIIQLVSLYVFIPIGYAEYGMTGALWSIVGAQFATIPMITWLQIRFGLFKFINEIKYIPVIFIGLIFGLAVSKIVADYF